MHIVINDAKFLYAIQIYQSHMFDYIPSKYIFRPTFKIYVFELHIKLEKCKCLFSAESEHL